MESGTIMPKIERSGNLIFANSTLEILPIVDLKHNVFIKQNPIVFIHPPKTGGTNIIYLVKAIAMNQDFLYAGLSAPYGAKSCYIIFARGFLGGIIKLKNNLDYYDCSKKKYKIYPCSYAPSLDQSF